MDFSFLELHEQAVPLHTEALQIYKAFAGKDPRVSKVNLANSIHNLAIGLRSLGDYEKALAHEQQVLELWNEFTSPHGNDFDSRLLNSLHNKAMDLRALGRLEEALQVHQEILHSLREFMKHNPQSLHNVNLAFSIHNAAVDHRALRRHKEALEYENEVLELWQSLAGISEETKNAYSAVFLQNAATDLRALEDYEGSLKYEREASTFYQGLVSNDERSTNNFSLIFSLNNIAADLGKLDRWEESLEQAQEALEIYNSLAEHPEESSAQNGGGESPFTPEENQPKTLEYTYYISLTTLSSALFGVGEYGKTCTTREEIVQGLRRLDRDNLQNCMPFLADALLSLATSFSSLGDHTRARGTAEEAILVYRQLAENMPAIYNGELQRALRTQNDILIEAGATEDAKLIKGELEETDHPSPRSEEE